MTDRSDTRRNCTNSTYCSERLKSNSCWIHCWSRVKCFWLLRLFANNRCVVDSNRIYSPNAQIVTDFFDAIVHSICRYLMLLCSLYLRWMRKDDTLSSSRVYVKRTFIQWHVWTFIHSIMPYCWYGWQFTTGHSNRIIFICAINTHHSPDVSILFGVTFLCRRVYGVSVNQKNEICRRMPSEFRIFFFFLIQINISIAKIIGILFSFYFSACFSWHGYETDNIRWHGSDDITNSVSFDRNELTNNNVIIAATDVIIM